MDDRASSACVFGLKYPARSFAAQLAEPDRSRFFVGTESPSNDNEIRLLDFDEEDFEITTQTFAHPDEVCDIAPSPTRADLIVTTYRHGSRFRSSLWMLSALLTNDAGKLCNQQGDLGELVAIEGPTEDPYRRLLWDASGKLGRMLGIGREAVTVLNMDAGLSKAEVETVIPGADLLGEANDEEARVQGAAWDPINTDEAAVGIGTELVGWDFRSNSQTFRMYNAHAFAIRDIDYNRNKPYHLATCGDDGKIRIWDTRKPEAPVKEIAEHTHWVWAVSFNAFHDQLLLSASSDCVVNLHLAASVSSAPFGLVRDDDSSDGESNEDLYQRKRMDELAASFRDFEDSVYGAAWSAADPWIFGSVSYDGRVLINMVPRAVKYSIIL